MNLRTRRLLSVVESLGDSREPDQYLESLLGPRASLFRWTMAPIEAVTALIERLPCREGYRFEALEPCAPGMVLDRDLGLRFHTSMRSSDVDGTLAFDDAEPRRRERHAAEKARFDTELAAFAARLADDVRRVYVVKANAGFAPDAPAALDAALARRSGGAHVLVSVTASGEATPPSWISDTHVAIGIASLAPYARPESLDADGWSALFDALAAEPRVRDTLDAIAAEGASASRTDRDRDDGAPRLAARTGARRFADWDRALPLDSKEERLYAMLGPIDDVDGVRRLLDELGDADAAYRLHVGGAILDALRAAGEHGADEGEGAIDESADDALAEDFDNRYARLMALHSNVDIGGTRRLNARGVSLYRRFGKSFVRYDRIDGALRDCESHFRQFVTDGFDVVAVAPMSDGSFARVSLPEGTAGADVWAAGGARPTLLELELAAPRERAFRGLGEHDHGDAAEDRWVEPGHEATIERLRFHLLPEACISRKPSSIVFRDGGAWRYATATGDMYHHSRVAGRVGLARERSPLPHAYFLPRFGPPGNHYHTLVDKLPTLYGYRLLGLDCPLVAAYEPNATMHHMMDLLGIERERVRVDLESGIVADRAIVPTPSRLRPLFVDFCASLPKGRSPLGPRIYIARGDASGRGMENEREVEASLARRGFDIVRMEEHDIEAQIAIAANADVIVAPHGAGMANMIFAPRGCRIVELIPERYMVRFFWQLAVDCGHRYGVLVGRMSESAAGDEPIGRTLRWRTDVEALERLVDEIGCRRVDRAA